MPIFNSDQWTANFAPGATPHTLMPTDWEGKVRLRRAIHTGAVGLADGDYVRMFPINRGERPVYFVRRNEAFGASVVAAVGFQRRDGTGSVDGKYLAAFDANTPAHAMVFPLITAGVETETGVVVVKFTGANPSDTADYELQMFFVVD